MKNTASPLIYTSTMGWLGDGSHRLKSHQAWTAVGLPPRYPQLLLSVITYTVLAGT